MSKECPGLEGCSHVGEAPGRLDVLGGVAEFSGALVLQAATEAKVVVGIRRAEHPVLSFHRAPSEPVSLAMELWRDCLERPSNRGNQVGLSGILGLPPWVDPLLGALAVLVKEKGWVPEGGMEFHVQSDLPELSGVCGSGAWIMAALHVLGGVAGCTWSGIELAEMAWRVQSDQLGIPCGLPDFLTCQFGRPGYLVPILCRPAILQRTVAVPPGIRIVGWPSGKNPIHAVESCTRARTAAFMGRKLLERATGRKVVHTSDFAPKEYRANQEHLAPAMLGGDFLDAWGGIDDPHGRVESGVVYPVRAATQFAIEEHDRVSRTVALFQRYHVERDESLLWEAGGHWYASHAGYHAMGLGSAETEVMLEQLRNLPLGEGIYGARLSGGGIRGMVVVLLKESGLPQLERLAQRITPGVPLVF